ncbi:reverse transcriptase domain-containing protein [Tanacetum coccineum]
MAGPESSTPPPLNQIPPPDPKTTEGQSVIEGYISALKTLCKDRACYELIKPRLLDFNDETGDEDEVVKKDKEKETPTDDDLSKPFKATSKCPFTGRIINFTAPNRRMPTNVKIYDGTSDPADHITRFTGMENSAEWPMPVWCRMFQQTLDGKARAWFDKLPSGSIDGWDDLEEKFLNMFGMLKACDKDPTEITKIVRRANETLPNFRERWVSESNAIPTDSCASFVSRLAQKPITMCAFTIADVAMSLSELNESLEMTNLTFPSCRGPLELPFSPFNFHLPLVLIA